MVKWSAICASATYNLSVLTTAVFLRRAATGETCY